jgi:cobalamin biosynthesis protein CobD/CbiB
MSLISIILALLLEQAQPVAVGRLNGLLARWATFLESRFNAGERQHGVAAWFVGAALPAALVLAAYVFAYWHSWVLMLLLGVGVLYLTTGFRQFSHHFTAIHEALRAGELDTARQLLATWRRRGADRLSSSEVARLAIEEALLASHRHVFAPLFWFVVLGPAGPLLYRLSRYFCYTWGAEDDKQGETNAFGEFSRRAFAALDWLPVRLTAASFAVVGNFEDAVFCWRSQAGRWPEEASGILLATGAGALGVRLGLPIDNGGVIGVRPELGLGDDADADFMQSAIGLAWRALVMALVLLVLLGIANWAG